MRDDKEREDRENFVREGFGERLRTMYTQIRIKFKDIK